MECFFIPLNRICTIAFGMINQTNKSLLTRVWISQAINKSVFDYLVKRWLINSQECSQKQAQQSRHVSCSQLITTTHRCAIDPVMSWLYPEAEPSRVLFVYWLIKTLQRFLQEPLRVLLNFTGKTPQRNWSPAAFMCVIYNQFTEREIKKCVEEKSKVFAAGQVIPMKEWFRRLRN